MRFSDPRLRLAAGVALFVVVLDQLTKAVVVAKMALYDQIDLTPFFALTYVRNRGAAFSALANVSAAVRVPLFLVVTVIAVGVLLTYLRDTPPERRLLIASFGAILGGAVGNLICRVRYGEVIDFLLLHWHDWQWPVFNVADTAISVGVTVLLLQSLRAPDFTRANGTDTTQAR